MDFKKTAQSAMDKFLISLLAGPKDALMASQLPPELEGVREYTLPEGGEFRWKSNLAMTPSPEVIVYKKGQEKNPVTKSHERLHVGQKLLEDRVRNDPRTIKTAKQMPLPKFPPQAGVNPRFLQKPDEHVSYRLSGESKKDGMLNVLKDSSKYLNLLRELSANPHAISTIEASMLPGWQEDFFKRFKPRPRGYIPPGLR